MDDRRRPPARDGSLARCDARAQPVVATRPRRSVMSRSDDRYAGGSSLSPPACRGSLSCPWSARAGGRGACRGGPWAACGGFAWCFGWLLGLRGLVVRAVAGLSGLSGGAGLRGRDPWPRRSGFAASASPARRLRGCAGVTHGRWLRAWPAARRRARVGDGPRAGRRRRGDAASRGLRRVRRCRAGRRLGRGRGRSRSAIGDSAGDRARSTARGSMAAVVTASSRTGAGAWLLVGAGPVGDPPVPGVGPCATSGGVARPPMPTPSATAARTRLTTPSASTSRSRWAAVTGDANPHLDTGRARSTAFARWYHRAPPTPGSVAGSRQPRSTISMRFVPGGAAARDALEQAHPLDSEADVHVGRLGHQVVPRSRPPPGRRRIARASGGR